MSNTPDSSNDRFLDLSWTLIQRSLQSVNGTSIEFTEAERHELSSLFLSTLNQAGVLYSFGIYHRAADCVALARSHLSANESPDQTSLLYFYEALIGLALYSTLDDSGQQQVLQTVERSEQYFSPTAHHAFYRQLIVAERDRVLGNYLAAIDGYDRAIALAEQRSYYEIGLANELAGRFYEVWSKPKLAYLHIREAYQSYKLSRAMVKVFDLEHQYPALMTCPMLEMCVGIPSANSVEWAIAHRQATVGQATEQTQPTGAALWEAQQRLAFHIENSPFATIEWDGDLRIRRWSKQAESIFGWSASEVLGKTWLDLNIVFEEDAETVMTAAQRLATGQNQRNTLHNRNYTKTGQVMDCEWYNSVLFDESGSLVSILSLVQDVTERKQTEAALQASEQKYRSLAENMTEGIYLIDDQGQLSYLNPAIELIFGRSAETLSQQYPDSVLACVHPDDWTAVATTLDRTAQGDRLEMSYRIIRPNGSIRYLRDTRYVVRDTQGNRQGYQGTISDVTVIRSAEQALRKSEQRYATLANISPVATFRADAAGRCTYVNRRWSEFSGLMAEKAAGFGWLDALHPEDQVRVRQEWAEAIAIQGNLSTECRFQQPDGTVVWLVAQAIADRDSDGQIMGYVGTLTNITARKQAEADLQRLNEELEQRVEHRTQQLLRSQHDLQQQTQLLQTILNSMGDGVIVVDTQGQLLLSNPAANRILGVDLHPSNAIARRMRLTDLPVFLPDGITPYPPDQLPIARAMRGAAVDQVGAVVSPDGQEARYTESTARPLLDQTGRLQGAVAVFRDVTERRRTELALRDSEERFRQLAENINEVFWVTSLDQSQILYTSPAYERIWGLSCESLLQDPSSWIDAVHPDDRDRVLDCLAHTAVVCQGYDEEYRILRPDRELRWIRERAFVIRNEAGEGYRLAGISEDITPQKQLEQKQATLIANLELSELALRQVNTELENRVEARTAELRDAMEAAQAANRSKSAFLARMSHELRTPLNAILGFSQLMGRNASLDQTQRQHLSIINRSGEHLLNLINDILEMSKIEAGRVVLNPIDINLWGFLDALEEMFQLRAANKGLQLVFEREVQLPQYIQVDEQKLRQILINLLGNAIKFTTQGHITLRMKLALPPDQPSPPSPHLTLEFAIEDTGPGIHPAHLSHLFEPFSQVQDSTLHQEGTGLGLAISRQFVRLMGGDLSVESRVGQGSTFRFTIQASGVESAMILPSTRQQHVIGLAPGQPSVQVLIVEDHWANRELLERLLTAVGLDVRLAENGQDAVRIWAEWRPDLIWMDMRMPVMDGYEATRQIRALERAIAPSHPTKIIALTASAFDEQTPEILQAGCDDLIRKPFQESLLFDKMTEHLGVQFIYSDQEGLDVAPVSTARVVLQGSALTVMPRQWIAALHEAALTLDGQQLTQLVGCIPAEHTTIAEALMTLIDNFDFEQILNLAIAALEL